MCRDGRVPDMKTELALARLADELGFVPMLDRFLWQIDGAEVPARLAAARAAWDASRSA